MPAALICNDCSHPGREGHYLHASRIWELICKSRQSSAQALQSSVGRLAGKLFKFQQNGRQRFVEVAVVGLLQKSDLNGLCECPQNEMRFAVRSEERRVGK